MSLTIESLKNEIEELKMMSQRATPTTIAQDLSHYIVKANGSPVRSVVFRDEIDRHHRSTESESEGEEEEFFDFTDDRRETGDADVICSEKTETDQLQEVIKRIDAMFEDHSIDKSLVFEAVSKACEKYGNPERLMYRRAKASHYMVVKASKDGNLHEKKRLAFKCVEHAKEGVQLYPSSAECNKWYAIAVGGVSDFVATKEKILNGSIFKEHVDKAIQLSPNDATLHHMLGRYCSTIASLSWIEKKVASTLFAELPQVTMKECYQHLKRAYDLRKDWKENIVHLAKAAFEIGLLNEGKKYLEEGISLPIKGEDDELAHQDLLQLKSKYVK